MFNSWLTCLRFSSTLNFKICNKLLKTFILKKKKRQQQQQNWYVFSLNTDLKFFNNKNLSVFSLNTYLKFFLNKKLVCIFIKYRSEIFSE